jgi:hypothetical protein
VENMNTIIATFTNVNDGVTSFVMTHQRGYNVLLRDDDSENFLPVSFVYHDKARDDRQLERCQHIHYAVQMRSLW